jgi:chromosome segregation ATPase
MGNGKETKEKVFTAAEALIARNVKPTAINIRKEIGGGSFSTIQEALREYQKTTQPTVTRTQINEPIPQNVGDKLTELGNIIWMTAAETANARLTAERKVIEAARQEAEAARDETIQAADQLTNELDMAAARIVALESEIAETRNKLSEAQTNLTMAQARIEISEARTTEVREELNRAYTDRDKALEAEKKAREEAATLRGRLEALEATL